MEKVCLLITVYNRGHLLRNSLERLTKLTLPNEVLIVDDGGNDNTKEICDSFIDKLPIKYIYNHNPNWSICSFARNIGVKNTDCEIIITSEPELLYCTDVIAQTLQNHKSNPNDIISAGSVYHMGNKATLHSDMINNPLERLKLEKVNVSTNNPTPTNNDGYVLIKNWQATYTALYRKEWIEQIGGWDEEFPDVYGVDDIDLCTRIRIKLGVNQIIDQDIVVLHQHHDRPLSITGQATLRNMKYFEDKKLSVNGIEDINNSSLVANKDKEWGIIKIR